MAEEGSFERRARERVAGIGERFAAQRRAVLERATAADDGVRAAVPEHGEDPVAAAPEHGEEAVRAATGRGWDEWRELIDAWPGHEDGHATVAAWLQDEHGVPGWWAQNVTVSWERLSGRRLPNQMADGTFTAGRSATIDVDHRALAALLRDVEALETLFPGLHPELRSRPTSRNVRIGLAEGVAEIHLAAKGDARATVTVAHAKLGTPGEVSRWKAYWGDWLQALDGLR
jgi:hypothetical protein